MQASQEIWLAVWTRAEKVVVDPSMRYYMSVYIAIGMGGIAIGFVRGIVLVLGTLRASQVCCCCFELLESASQMHVYDRVPPFIHGLHEVCSMKAPCHMKTADMCAVIDSGILYLQVMHDRLLDKVFSLPMAFFDTQPSGRLISRFSKDVGSTDLNLPSLFQGLSQCIVGTLVSTAVVTGVTKGAVLLALVPLVPLYLSVQRHYLATSRELNRLQSVTSSPILSNFGETLAGLMTVRAFRKQARPSPLTA